VQTHLSIVTTRAASAEHFVHAIEGRGGKIFAVVFGLLVLIGGTLLAIGVDTWEMPAHPVIAVGFLLFTMLVVFNFARARLFGRSKVRPAIVGTPILMAKTGLDHEPVAMHYHKDLQKPEITHHHHNGSYTHTSFVFSYTTGALNFDIRNRARADAFITYLQATNGLLRGWAESGEIDQKIREFDWITAATQPAPEQKKQALPAGRGLLRSGWMKLGLSGLLTLLITGFAWGGNLVQNEMHHWDRACRYDGASDYDYYLHRGPLQWHAAEAIKRKDDSAFKDAVRARTAGALRTYRQNYPTGLHRDEARDAIRALYAAAETAYLEKSAKAIPAAHEGMKALLAHLRDEDKPVVRICFAPAEGIDGKDIEAAIALDSGSKHVHPVGPSFSAEANAGRETRIIGIMGASLNKVFSDDLFQLQRSTPEEPGARFFVKYKVIGGTDVYTMRSEVNLPKADRQVWVGIQINFTFSLQVPGSSHLPDADPLKGYAFAMTATPAPNFTVSGANPSPSDVYDRMVETAFQEFEVNLANAYGLELVMPSDWGKIPGVRTDESPLPFKMPEIPKFNTPGLTDLIDPLGKVMREVTTAAFAETPRPALAVVQARVLAEAKRRNLSVLLPSELKMKTATKWNALLAAEIEEQDK
jgi:hypothetical protein